MIKFIITETSQDGRLDCKGAFAVEETEPVHPAEIKAMLETFTGEVFQRQVKSVLRRICSKHHIPTGTIPGL
jgi:hypothetical protein